jgi:SPP1 gp7 family putative phage head morphogenesis protein
MPLPTGETPGEFLSRIIDRGYDGIARQVIDAISGGSASGIVAQRLAEVEAEAARLAQIGEKLSPDNPIIRALIADLDDQMKRNASAINSAAGRLQSAGADAGQTIAQQLPLGFMDDAASQQAAGILVGWNRVSLEAISQVIDLINNPEWTAMLSKYGESVPDAVAQIALRGFLEGWSPLRAAEALTDVVTNLPQSYANTLMRTLYLNAYRRATTESYKANGDIVEYAVRVATLDHRVCMACILLHGTIIPLDEVVADHWNGRCTSVAKIRGIPLNIQTGKDWFAGLGADQQAAMMGGSAYRAWQDGAIQLDDLVHVSDDPLFGGMVGTASLSGILGEGASQYYLK